MHRHRCRSIATGCAPWSTDEPQEGLADMHTVNGCVRTTGSIGGRSNVPGHTEAPHVPAPAMPTNDSGTRVTSEGMFVDSVAMVPRHDPTGPNSDNNPCRMVAGNGTRVWKSPWRWDRCTCPIDKNVRRWWGSTLVAAIAWNLQSNPGGGCGIVVFYVNRINSHYV